MKISAHLFQSYFVCKRQTWFIYNKMYMQSLDENVKVGKLIHKYSFPKEKKESIKDENISIDFKKGKEKLVIFEIKKSSKLKEPAIWQMYFYLWYLKNKRKVTAEGILLFPKEKRREKIILTKDIEKRIEEVLKEIKEIVRLPSPPKEKFKPYCKKCSYYEMCFV